MSELFNEVNERPIERTVEKSNGVIEFAQREYKSKRGTCIGICISAGVIAAILVMLLIFSQSAGKLNEIRGFSGERPTYEEYQYRILSHIYKSNNDGTYTLEVMPDSEEFQEWLYDNIGGKRTEASYLGSQRFVYQYKMMAPNFSAVDTTAQGVFEQVLDARVREANKATGMIWLQYLAIMAVIAGIIVGIFIWYTRGVRRYVDAAEKGAYSLTAATLIGREKEITKRTRDYFLEVQTVKGETKKCRVSEAQYDLYQSGKTAYVVTWGSEFGLYDEEDIYVC